MNDWVKIIIIYSLVIIWVLGIPAIISYHPNLVLAGGYVFGGGALLWIVNSWLAQKT